MISLSTRQQYMISISLFIIVFITSAIKTENNTFFEIGLNYQKNEQFSDAITIYKKIISTQPYHTNALFNLGHCYLATGKIDKAITSYQKILALEPNLLPVMYNIAYTKKTSGQLEEAIKLYQQIISIKSDYEPAHLALGFAYLTNGDFENGWQQHSRYLRQSNKNGDQLRALLTTDSLHGKNILLIPEGGLGDTLQFIRYSQRLHEMGANVTVMVQKALVPLLSQCTYIDRLLSSNDQIPEHDASATLMSLPAIFNDNEETFPATIPYLNTDTQLVEQWKTFLKEDSNFKIGICWQADIKNDESRLPIARRGCALINFMPLQDIQNISLYSLQKYDGVDELKKIPNNFHITHFDTIDEKSGAFIETAALMQNLDLIITVDTAVAHLAGALGRPVWLLLPYSTDWRWINGRTDSPWYPTMKIFKQKRPLDWEPVINNICNELKQII